MSSICRTALLGVALIVLNGFATAAAPDAPPTKEQIARWVVQLGDKDFATRNEASKRLWEAGELAEPAVAAASKSEDAEVKRRAREILDKFKWGIYPQTPKPIVELIRRYQGAEHPAKVELLRELYDEGIPGCRALVRIAAAEDDAAMRDQVYRLIGNNLTRFMPLALVENKFDLVERLLDLGVQSEDAGKTNFSNYCAYYSFRGKLDERIKDLDGKKDRTKLQSELLAYLYRAKGELKAAKQTADQAGIKNLPDQLLYEMGDWQELAKRDVDALPGDLPEKHSFCLAYKRLSGDAAGFDEALAAYRKKVETVSPEERPIQSYYLAKALLLNDRPVDALPVLEQSGHYIMLFEILCTQFKYRDAFELVEKARKQNYREMPLLEIRYAQKLGLLGEKDKAIAILKHRGDVVVDGDSSCVRDLIEAQCQIGLRDEAYACAAKVLDATKDAGELPKIIGPLFPGQGEDAEMWWTTLRQLKPGQTTTERMKDLRDLFEGKLAADRIATLIEQAQGQSKTIRPDDLDRWWQALANIAHTAKLDHVERACLEKGATSVTLTRLGDLHAEKKEWVEAAAAYRRAWDRAPVQPLPLLLAGKALLQTDGEAEGNKLVAHAHALPLGDASARGDFAVALARRGFAEDARRENELILKLGEAGSYYGGDAERRLGDEAALQKDFQKAAASQQRALLRCLRTYVRFVENPAYLGVPTLAHRYRARALLEAGKFDEAWKEITYCRTVLPGDLELAILLVPELEQRGHKKEADELFTATVAVYKKIGDDYPKCSWAPNAIAWLSACCRRDLETALGHAKKAVELAPTNPGHRDTLAEVYFQLGQKDKALAEAAKAVELGPKRSYFQLQLKRIAAGDPKAERPPDVDDEE